jgi:hypothetical protein
MDVHFSEGGTTTADKVHKREEFRLLIADVQRLPETQKTALLLREIDALSYEQIAEAMETTIPSVKSLLVRARVSLAEAAEARLLTCDDVREELGEVAEGLRRSTAPARRHLRTCERCQCFKSQLRTTNRALAAVFPVAPLLLAKKALLAQFGMTASAGAGSAAGATAAGVAATGGTSAMTAGISTIATKAAAGLAAAAIVTGAAVEVKQVQTTSRAHAAAVAAAPAAPVRSAPEVVASLPQPSAAPKRAAAAKDTSQTHGATPRKKDPKIVPATASTATPDGAGDVTTATSGTPALAIDTQPDAPEHTGGAAGPAEAAPEASPPPAPPPPLPDVPAEQDTAGTVVAEGSGGVIAAP